MGDNNPKRSNGTKMSELNALKCDLGSCCSNKPNYLITYRIGTKWLVCNECLEVECFNSGILTKEKTQ